MKTRPEALLQAAREQLGGAAEARELSWPHGESQVWLLRAGPVSGVPTSGVPTSAKSMSVHAMSDGSIGGAPAGGVLKVHARARKFDQELAAYRDWLPQLERVEGEGQSHRIAVPRLFRSWAEERALLLSLLPGVPLSLHTVAPLQGERLEPNAERAAHRRAGEFLRKLHELPHRSDDPVSLEDAFGQRLEAWTVRSRDVMSSAGIASVQRRVTEILPELNGYGRVPCHRDFTPRNWLIDPAREEYLGVIDFEHARADLWLADMTRLWSGEWHGRPELRESFLGGYGATLDSAQSALLDGLSALEGLATVTWAREHGDPEFEVRGRAVLGRLGIEV